jgi:hypothetical protein
MPVKERSPFARLVLFLICLSLAGTLVAGGYWYAAGLSEQKTPAPENSGIGINSPGGCARSCYSHYCFTSIPDQPPQCEAGYAPCMARCSKE